MSFKKNISQKLDRKKLTRRRVNDCKKKIGGCSPEELQEVLEEVERDPYLSDKKKRNLKVKILNRSLKKSDLPEYLLQRLENDRDPETKFWARDTRNTNEKQKQSEEIKLT